jgi:Tfp pilus assembly protein PilX
MRAARATLLGLSLDQLLAYDNRQTLIRQKMREHGLSFEDAESYVRDMEQDARRERQERQSEDLSGWERALVQRNHGPDWEPPV